jgi:hypothetical protein
MLALFSPYKLLIEIVVIGAIALGGVWGIHSFLEGQQQKGYDKAVGEYKEKLVEAKEAAKVREAELRALVTDAQAKGNEREQTIRDVAASGAAASNGLRDTLAHIRRSSSGASVEALANSVTTLTTVFDDCQTKYRAMAETADRHASDSKTLSDAWPVAQPAK